MLKASPVVQTVKNPPAMQETRVWSLGQEDPLEKEMATIHYHKNFVNVLSLSKFLIVQISHLSHLQ